MGVKLFIVVSLILTQASCKNVPGNHKVIASVIETSHKENDFLKAPGYEDVISTLNELKTTVKNQAKLINDQTEHINDLTNRLEHIEKSTGNDVPKTCRELYVSGERKSGEYIINPSGSKSGQEPITVYCNMDEGGVTQVYHDSMGPIDVTSCEAPGCYSRDIDYNISMTQIQAIKDNSANCGQFIKYECILSPLQDEDVNYAWWVGTSGQRNYYWTGDFADHGNATDIHMCLCGLNQTCVNDNFVCNCDAQIPDWETDAGYITNKAELPIVEVNFGHTLYDLQEGVHTVGPLQCWGEIVDVVFDASMTSGYYSYFNTPLPFTNIHVNIGDGMDSNSGVFTAPIPGVYHFSVQLRCDYYSTSDYTCRALMYHEDSYGYTNYLSASETYGYGGYGYTFNMAAMVEMETGDTVYVELTSGELYESSPYDYSHFMGFRVQGIH